MLPSLMHLGMGFRGGLGGGRVRPPEVTISGTISRHGLSYTLTKRSTSLPAALNRGAYFVKIELEDANRVTVLFLSHLGEGGVGKKSDRMAESGGKKN